MILFSLRHNDLSYDLFIPRLYPLDTCSSLIFVKQFLNINNYFIDFTDFHFSIVSGKLL